MAHSTTSETMDKLQQSADQLGTNACGMMRSAQETAADWTQKAQDNLEALSNAASGYVEEGQKTAKALGRTVSQKVQESPVAALLLAAGLGILVGIMLKRR
ncbi:MAG: hypothetical protein ABSG53_03075 [Thermoguttaceae bacterium]|jgi:ElaB/YqjD/DUF883 family membrane-anchored ribosome-binding protein